MHEFFESDDSRCGACAIDPILIVPGIKAPKQSIRHQNFRTRKLPGQMSGGLLVLQVRVVRELEGLPRGPH
jgi:hypothetical protein